ncbi:MAG: PH domain-containing protein [Halodesulfurarchaeum sp.]
MAMNRSLHFLTVPVRGASRAIGVVVVGSILGSMLTEMVSSLGPAFRAVPPLGVILAVLLGAVVIGYEWLRYRHYAYELGADALHIQSGVLFRRTREIPLRRVQNVDITRSFVQRALGIAAVGIETAGGTTTEATLQFVSHVEANRLQEGIRTRKAELRKRDEPATATTEEPTRGEETVLFELSDEDLLIYSVLSFDPRLLSVLFVLAPAVAPFGRGFVEGRGTMMVAVLAVFGLLILFFGTWAVSAFGRFVGYYGFRLTRVGDELRYERGLLQRYDGSIPEEKIQTIVVEENVLMRQFDYASLAIETAGYGPGGQAGTESAVPLAKRESLLELAREVEPFGPLDFHRPAPTAKRRYTVRYGLVITGLIGLGFATDHLLASWPWFVLAGLYPVALLAARKKYRHRGYGLLDGYFLTRDGFWRRRTSVVPESRLQTVIDRRTLFQRRWNLATVIFDTASSSGFIGADAKAIDIPAERANQVREAAADALLSALGIKAADEPPGRDEQD